MGERGLFPFILPLLACLHNSFLKGETCINWSSTSIPSYVVLDVCWWEAQKLMVVYLCRNWVYFTFAYKSVVSITRSSITLLLNPSRAKVNLTCYFHAFSSFPSPHQLWYFLSSSWRKPVYARMQFWTSSSSSTFYHIIIHISTSYYSTILWAACNNKNSFP